MRSTKAIFRNHELQERVSYRVSFKTILNRLRLFKRRSIRTQGSWRRNIREQQGSRQKSMRTLHCHLRKFNSNFKICVCNNFASFFTTYLCTRMLMVLEYLQKLKPFPMGPKY